LFFFQLRSRMHFTTRTAFAAHALAVISLLSITASAAPSFDDSPSKSSTLGKRDALSVVGCYSSSEGLTEGGTYLYQSSSYCAQSICTGQQSVMGLTNGNDCWCGNEIPPASSKVDDAKCNIGCTGFGTAKCEYLAGTAKLQHRSR
jgi:cell wall integrity and stress response component